MEKRNRRARTPRATQPVCERMLSKSAAKNAVSRKEMVFPSVQLNFCLPSQRSTRFQTGKDKIPGICRSCAPSRGRFRARVFSHFDAQSCGCGWPCKGLASSARVEYRSRRTHPAPWIFSSHSCSRFCRRIFGARLSITPERISSALRLPPVLSKFFSTPFVTPASRRRTAVGVLN